MRTDMQGVSRKQALAVAADTVSDMRVAKHACVARIKAQKGIEL